ncbi:hypothetical protein DPMN_064583 [Dreissena polymorpha]|uniref:Uncharacterized protein n=1 Tax=Dreissena polymorpha TaxID=45954 RepID=A0A9D4CCF9_DREPO|nr:hypothetical protein DPMN_064550 [Dreissena polymorpha]KAH3721640.1 hypothetical protein DPMN_064583 [Dreissena polymorpha]
MLLEKGGICESRWLPLNYSECNRWEKFELNNYLYTLSYHTSQVYGLTKADLQPCFGVACVCLPATRAVETGHGGTVGSGR